MAHGLRRVPTKELLKLMANKHVRVNEVASGGIKMPYCKKCGNHESLASSYFLPSSETATAPPYGLLGNFNQEGYLTTLECQGASLDDAQEAFERPEIYFDTCPSCGSHDIHW